MKTWAIRLLLVAAAASLGFWLSTVFFPGPDKVIRKRLEEVALLASFQPNEGALAKLNNAQRLTGCFARDAQISVEVPGYSHVSIQGRDQLFQSATAARQMATGLEVELLDIQVTVESGKTAATAVMTAKARAPGDRDILVQELKFLFRKIDGDWLIQRIETVKTLRLSAQEPPLRV